MPEKSDYPSHESIDRESEASEYRPEGPKLEDSIQAAARKAGLAPPSEASGAQGAALLRAMGGVRGIAEAIVPGLVFLVVYAFARELVWALVLSVGTAVIFTLARVVTRSAPTQAIAGLLGAAASALLALWTGRAEDNFVLGLITNGVYGTVLLVSMLVRWPLIGLAIGYLMGDGTRWRRERGKFRAMQLITACWVALFAVRLAVQLPLYFASGVEGNVEMLAAAKLLMGIPLYVPLLLLTWLVTRSIYGSARNDRPKSNDVPRNNDRPKNSARA